MITTMRPNLINRVFVDENDELTYKIVDVIDERETVTVVRVDAYTHEPIMYDERGHDVEQSITYSFDLDLALDLLSEYARRAREHVSASAFACALSSRRALRLLAFCRALRARLPAQNVAGGRLHPRTAEPRSALDRRRHDQPLKIKPEQDHPSPR
jgi:hypothetical protein